MTNEELRSYVDQILSYLKSDFDAYEEARAKGVGIGAGPYLLTASSGIDFLGSLAVPKHELKGRAKKGRGLERKSAAGSKWYISNYLHRVSSIYSNTNVGELIYVALRCGQVHEGIVKKGVLIGTKMNKTLHLQTLKLKESYSEGSPIKVVYINTRILASDFVKSTEYFRENMNNDDSFANEMATRLSEHLRETGDVCQNLDLPEQEVDHYTFDEIYNVSSCSPEEMEGYYTLRNRFWEMA